MTEQVKQEKIAEEYQEFWRVAVDITNSDVQVYPLEKKESERERMSYHLIDMIEMYQIRHGDPEQKKHILDFLEHQLFRTPPIEDEVCHLTLDMWKDLRKTIMSNEYRKVQDADTNS